MKNIYIYIYYTYIYIWLPTSSIFFMSYPFSLMIWQAYSCMGLKPAISRSLFHISVNHPPLLFLKPLVFFFLFFLGGSATRNCSSPSAVIIHCHIIIPNPQFLEASSSRQASLILRRFTGAYWGWLPSGHRRHPCDGISNHQDTFYTTFIWIFDVDIHFIFFHGWWFNGYIYIYCIYITDNTIFGVVFQNHFNAENHALNHGVLGCPSFKQTNMDDLENFIFNPGTPVFHFEIGRSDRSWTCSWF